MLMISGQTSCSAAYDRKRSGPSGLWLNGLNVETTEKICEPGRRFRRTFVDSLKLSDRVRTISSAVGHDAADSHLRDVS